MAIVRSVVRPVVRSAVNPVDNRLGGSWSSYWASNQFDNGKLVLTFDDAARSQYITGLPIFQTKGIAVTCYVHKGRYVDDAQYMTSAELLAMHNAGMDIQNHTYDHLYGTPSILDLNEIEYLEQIQLLSDKLVTEDITAPVHFAYPGGLHNDAVEKYGSQLVKSSRVGGPYAAVHPDCDKMIITDYVIDQIDDAGVIALKAEMDAAMAGKYAIVTSTHKIAAEAAQTITPERLTAIIDYAQAIGMDIITMSELYPLLHPQPVLFNVYATNTTTNYLTWAVDVTGVRTYIERSTDAVNYSVINVAADGVTNYTDTGLTPGAVYYYRLRLGNPTGYSAYTEVQSSQTFITQSLSFITRSIAAGETMGVKHQGVYNEAIVALDNATLFDDRFDCFWILKGIGRATTKLNLIKNAHNLEEVLAGGAITYADKTGYASDGTNSYLRTHYIPSSDAAKLSQNDASLEWKVNGALHTVTFYGIGTTDGTHGLGCTSKATQGYPAINSGNGTLIPVNGYNCLARSLAASYLFYRAAASDAQATVSNGLPITELTLLARNVNGTIAAWDPRPNELAFAGGYITQAEFLVIQGIMNTFFDKI